MRWPLVILSPLLGTLENEVVMEQFDPLWGPREGMGEVATSDYLPFVGVPQERRGYVRAPCSWGHVRGQG